MASTERCDWCSGPRVETVLDTDLDREFDVCERHLRATEGWETEYETVEDHGLRADGGEIQQADTDQFRPPSETVARMSPTANHEGLERRVCPNCRLYFDTGEKSAVVFCSRACRERHQQGRLIADGGEALEADAERSWDEIEETPKPLTRMKEEDGSSGPKYSGAVSFGIRMMLVAYVLALIAAGVLQVIGHV